MINYWVIVRSGDRQPDEPQLLQSRHNPFRTILGVMHFLMLIFLFKTLPIWQRLKMT